MDPAGTMLGVWGHPDDETYLTAGLMAVAAQERRRVVCVTATKGEEGSFDEERWPTPKMGEIRAAELMRSLEILGVSEHHWLEYHDGTCASIDLTEGVERVGEFVRSVEPDSVFTFGPDGMTGHPDHKAVSAWTTEAFERWAKPGARLLYATTTPDWAERWVPVFNRFDVFGPGTPPVTPREELAIAFHLPADLLSLKLEAIAAQQSQVEGMMQAFGEDVFRESQKEEQFRLAAEK